MPTAAPASVVAARRMLAARALGAPLAALAAQIDAVRAARDVEAVHKTRVASRRIRNALDLFFDALPPAQRPGWLRRIRRVTRALGAARDLDVQLLYLDEFAHRPHAPDVRRGLALLGGALAARRRRQQKAVRKAMDRLEADAAWHALRRWAARHAPPADEPAAAAPPALRAEAARAVHARLADVLAYARYVPRPRCVKPLHAMRIAAKHLRYTVEVYAPLYPRGLGRLLRWGRWLQDTLGALHDCDVWQAELPALCRRALRGTEGDRATRAALARAGAAVRADRAARRRALHAELVTWWSQRGDAAARRLFRGALGPPPAPPPRPVRRAAPPPPFDVGGDPRWAPALRLARDCRYEAAHTHHVTYLALRLFDELAPLHGLGPRARTWLGWAGLLHDIGWLRGRAGHHKTAARLIETSARLPWPERVRRRVALIARYHRRALPRLEHGRYGALPAADRRTVAWLAALLRLADGLDYSHQGLVRDVRVRISSARVTVLCSGRGPAAADLARGREKSDLARRVLGREVVVRWHELRADPTDRS